MGSSRWRRAMLRIHESLRSRLSKNLRAEREKRGWSQNVAAKQYGISQPYLKLLEAGTHAPSFTVLEKIGHALGLDPADLLKE